MEDPFRSTLLVLPLVIVGLWAVGQWIRRRSGPLVSRQAAGMEAAALTVLILAILGRRHLGVTAASPGIDHLLAGGLAVVLAYHVLALVRGLAQVYGSEIRDRPPWPFFLLPLVVFVAVMPWAATQREPDGDEPYFLLIAHSLAYDFDTDLANNYAEQDSLRYMSRALEREWADPVRSDGRVHSRHSLVLPLLLAPGYRLSGRWGAMATMAVLTALVVWLALSLGGRYCPGRSEELVWVWALLGLSPPLLLYSHQIWAEVPAALLILLALHQIDDLRQVDTSSKRHWLLLAVTLAVLPLLKLRFVVVSVSLLALAWWRSIRSRVLVLGLIGAVLLATLGILFYNQVVFGNLFKDHTLEQLIRIQHRSPSEYLQGLLGLFWDCAFGLFATNPLWLLLLPAVLLVAWRRSRLLTDLVICGLPYLALVSPRQEWFGAWSPPFRFGIALLPLLALALVPLFERRRRAGAQAIVAALAVIAASLALLWLVVPGWSYNLASGTNHLADHLSERLAVDTGRFLPSMVRVRAASWLVPLIAGTVSVFVWWMPKRRPGRAGEWGVGLMLVIIAMLPLVAHRIPTRWVEIEDRQVVKKGGELYPEPWVPFRPRYRGGWSLAPGDSVRMPIVPGGERVSIDLDLNVSRGAGEESTVEVAAGDQILGSWPLGEIRGWQTLSLEDREWSPGRSLVFRVLSGEIKQRAQRVILDRVSFQWH